MRAIILFVILFTFFLAGQDSELKVVKIDVSSSSKANISEIANNSSLIKLETSESCLIKRVKTLSITKDYIFISDNGDRILEFDRKGIFLRQIGREGRGPGEYLGVIHFTVDSIKNYVIVLSYKKISIYDFHGNFIRSVNLNYLSIFIQPVGNEYWIFSAKYEPLKNDGYLNYVQMFTLSQQFSVIDSSFVFNKVNSGMSDNLYGFVTDMFPISDLGNHVYMYYPYTMAVRDTLYEVRDSKLIPSIKFNFQSVRSVYPNLIISHIFRTNRFVFVKYLISKSSNYIFCYDLFKEKALNVPYGFNDDIYGTGVIEYFKPLNLSRNEFYYVKDGYKLDGIIDGVNENSNPVIFLITLKE